MAEKPILRLDPVTRLRVARSLHGKTVTLTRWCGGRKDTTSNIRGTVLGCGGSPWGGGADVIVLDSDRQPGRGYLIIVSLAEVAYVELPGGQVLTGKNAVES